MTTTSTQPTFEYTVCWKAVTVTLVLVHGRNSPNNQILTIFFTPIFFTV